LVIMRLLLSNLFFLFFLLASRYLSAQSPIASFSMPITACLNEQVVIGNTSTNASGFIWDFCQQDLISSPGGSLSITLPNTGTFYYHSIKILYYKGEWIGFCTDMNGVKLYRLDFGSSLDNNPTVVSLGTLAGFSSPASIELIEAGSTWYAFILNLFGNTLIRVRFGNGLKAAPTLSEDLGNMSGQLNTPSGVKMIYINSKYYAYVTNLGLNTVCIIDFGNSPQNAPVATNAIGQSVLVAPYGISLISQGSSLYGLVGSFSSSKTFKLNFGTDPFSIPAISEIDGIPSGADLEFAVEGQQYYGLVRSISDGLYRIDFGTDLSISSATVNRIGTLSLLTNQSRNISLVRDTPSWKAFTLDASTGDLYRIDFIGNCSSRVSFDTSTSLIPKNISYKVPGSNSIELTAYDAQGNRSVASQIIVISSNVAPDIDYSSQNNCIGKNVNFSPINQSGNIISYAWDLGDGGNSSSSNPTHVYSIASTYTIGLKVTSSDGCANRVQKPLPIFNVPQASFDLPTSFPICTNQNYLFTNTSTFDIGSNPTWQWSVNGLVVNGTKDLNYVIGSTASQDVLLTTSIPGCSSQATKSLNTVLQGPAVSFNSPTSGCVNSSIGFINTTPGVVSDYSWDFGDGTTSTQISPSNIFSTARTFTIVLSASNSSGCQNSSSKPLTIYSTPQPNFSIGLPPFSCERSPSQFTDLTPSPTDSNIASWTWGFGDAAKGASTFKNPTYTYPTANNYNVSLTVGTNFGCTNTIQKPVTIAPSPVANFTSLPACVNQVTQFTDASTGGLKSRLWQIQSSTFTTPNPQFTFSASGSFPVFLTITGNNNCVNQVSKDINVPVPPSLDFSVQAPCANNSTVFMEITNSTDPSVSQAWAFGSQANGSGSPAQYSFSTPNNYLVRLNSTRQSGCVYSFSKNVSIIGSPLADFSPSVDAGASPLSVSFANNSTLADSYLWKFGDGNATTSIQAAPTFIFSTLGDYEVELTAFNTVGCTDQTSKLIRVVVPRIDAVMEDFFFIKDASTGDLQAVVQVLNKSNVSLADPVILLDVTGGALVKKKISGILKPNQEVTQLLDFQIIPRSINYVCAEVEVMGDVDLFQNKKCVSLSGDEVLFSPYPNPAQAELNMDWISAEGSPVTVLITNSAGSVSLQQAYEPILPGLNRLIINTTALASGVYYIRFSDNKAAKSFGFAIVGN
jgi:PKD repeat protein